MTDDQKILYVLKELGFNEKEAQVYLVSLKLGRFASISTLAELTRINRASLYYITSSLMEKKFLKTLKINDVICFLAQPVQMLFNVLKEKKDIIKDKCNLIKSTASIFQNIKKTKEKLSEMETYYGTKAVLDFYTNLPWNDLQYSVFSVETYEKLFSRETFYGTGSLDTLRSIRGKVILSQTNHEAHFHGVNINKTIPRLSTGILNAGKLNTDTIIFSNEYVAIINLDPDNLYGIKINSRSLVESYLNMFEHMWGRVKITS